MTAEWSEPGLPRRVLGSSSIEGNTPSAAAVVTAVVRPARKWLTKMWSINSGRPQYTRQKRGSSGRCVGRNSTSDRRHLRRDGRSQPCRSLSRARRSDLRSAASVAGPSASPTQNRFSTFHVISRNAAIRAALRLLPNPRIPLSAAREIGSLGRVSLRALTHNPPPRACPTKLDVGRCRRGALAAHPTRGASLSRERFASSIPAASTKAGSRQSPRVMTR
jgi:hypothetical protein